jgi:hypothetical protein
VAGDGRAGTGLCVAVVVCRTGGADVLDRTFCAEALASEALALETLASNVLVSEALVSATLATARAIWSWPALSCSTALALSRAICSCLVFSSSIPCPKAAMSRAIDCSNCVSSGETGAGAGGASCGEL